MFKLLNRKSLFILSIINFGIIIFIFVFSALLILSKAGIVIAGLLLFLILVSAIIQAIGWFNQFKNYHDAESLKSIILHGLSSLFIFWGTIQIIILYQKLSSNITYLLTYSKTSIIQESFGNVFLILFGLACEFIYGGLNIVSLVYVNKEKPSIHEANTQINIDTTAASESVKHVTHSLMNFIKSKTGKLISIIVAICLVIGIGTSIYFKHFHKVKIDPTNYYEITYTGQSGSAIADIKRKDNYYQLPNEKKNFLRYVDTNFNKQNDLKNGDKITVTFTVKATIPDEVKSNYALGKTTLSTTVKGLTVVVDKPSDITDAMQKKLNESATSEYNKLINNLKTVGKLSSSHLDSDRPITVNKGSLVGKVFYNNSIIYVYRINISGESKVFLEDKYEMKTVNYYYFINYKYLANPLTDEILNDPTKDDTDSIESEDTYKDMTAVQIVARYYYLDETADLQEIK